MLSAAHQKHHQAKLSNKLFRPPRAKCQTPCPGRSESGSSQLGLETCLVFMTTHGKHLELRIGEVRDKTRDETLDAEQLRSCNMATPFTVESCLLQCCLMDALLNRTLQDGSNQTGLFRRGSERLTCPPTYSQQSATSRPLSCMLQAVAR